MNQIMHYSEHSSPLVDHLTPDMIELSDTFWNLGMMDLRFQGCSHTWTNKSSSGPITKKLDRALVNEAWLDSFPDSSTKPFKFLSTPLPFYPLNSRITLPV